MILKREQIEEREQSVLAPYAAKSSKSRGREFDEGEDPYRTCFQRDRDRVIHSKSFRRLRGKTQVFVAHYGDHYRSRLTHTMEVAQLSRDLARMLALNEDLAETIALAHDLGHTPFGHAGQDALNEMMLQHGLRFEHNEQSRRVVEFLEKKNPHYPGLNLTFEVRDGLIKHRTDYDNPTASDLVMPSLEAQIVNIADEIAYQNHDIDDGLRSGILAIEDLKTLSIWQKAIHHIDSKLSGHHFISAMISGLIALMINDLVLNTDHLIQKGGVQSVENVYKTNHSLASFSDEMTQDCADLKKYLYKHFYQSPGVHEYNSKGQEVVQFLFSKMTDDPMLLPDDIRAYSDLEDSIILVKDYIAGMTDQFALNLYDQLKG